MFLAPRRSQPGLSLLQFFFALHPLEEGVLGQLRNHAQWLTRGTDAWAWGNGTHSGLTVFSATHITRSASGELSRALRAVLPGDPYDCPHLDSPSPDDRR